MKFSATPRRLEVATRQAFEGVDLIDESIGDPFELDDHRTEENSTILV